MKDGIRPLERLGRMVGRAVAPVFGAASRLREARVFHPEGASFHATVNALATSGPLAPLARRLEGSALVRFSPALWRGREWPDVLGCAIRFHGRRPRAGEPAERPPEVADEHDQDVLLATFPYVVLLPFAPAWTDPHDFLANTYHGGAPLEVEGVGAHRVRVVPPRIRVAGGDRFERLENAVAEGHVALRFDARSLPAGWWTPVAEIALEERVAVDESRLRFSPFRAGAGLRARGFIQALRAAPYARSQAARGRRAA